MEFFFKQSRLYTQLVLNQKFFVKLPQVRIQCAVSVKPAGFVTSGDTCIGHGGVIDTVFSGDTTAPKGFIWSKRKLFGV